MTGLSAGPAPAPAPPGGRAAAGQPLHRRVTVRGTVQGVGFRPFVHRLAHALGLAGSVHNAGGAVVAEVTGPPGAVAEFCRRLRTGAPPPAAVRSLTVESLPGPPAARDGGFVILPSRAGADGAAAEAAAIPPDTAPCADCLRDLTDPRDRRYRHPFVTCTHCGPRLTLATGLPYDRAATTMAAFPLCPDCAREYADPADRRFHAQPVACPACGPRLRFTPGPGGGESAAEGEDALAAARRLLARGAIVAVKGIGGYHLACDAGDARAVRELRRRKRRGARPFAVMCADAATAGRLGRLTDAGRRVLTGPRRPVVLLRRRAPGALPGLAGEVCPGSPDVGVLLPYAPLHHLLFGLDGDPPGPRVLVMTSGNRSGEPLVTDDAEARERLAGLADAWLWHDREIAVPCDDSVVRVRDDGTELVLRRSRGYAPEPLELPVAVRPALAVGGDLKNALCAGRDRTAWFSPHIGDLGGLAALRALAAGERRLRALTGTDPELLAADRHPGYHSARFARERAAGRPLHRVQHHHAHIASAMAEHGLDGTAPVIGVAFDGTGYGEDGAVWGGEVLLADYAGHRRLAHLAYAPLPGGDAAVANPCRTALARLRAARLPWDPDLPCVAACEPAELAVLDRQLGRGFGCVPGSGMGRLFDAVSSLTGLCHRAGYEAQAALELEAAAVAAWPEGGDGYAFALRPAPGTDAAPPLLLDPAPVLRAIVADLRGGVPAALIAARFHRGLAAAVVALCGRARRRTGVGTVVLTGGVFANALLDQECAVRLTAAGFTVLRHGRVPPGDGGLALGQLLVAARAPAGGGPPPGP
ncbi:carbamoyltransferase HypF [Streptomyces aidingensis]|uniref:Carbamoyltransferase n=1 Tax=Streptomyces aidingensis TaxID=910347 RepID=A0A1I1P9Q5_9ACTN|nr:carbamoyltransferase HypF [Streptomyces aidingensis]SFD06539.1 hydrogenase maturation protein HypF [Streptomyces aidingensis]